MLSIKNSIRIHQLTGKNYDEAVRLVFDTGLDTREEIVHHLQHMNAHFIALDQDKVIGVIGWYRDDMNYATEAMGHKFPGKKAYWVGFFVVDQKYRRQGIGYALLTKLEQVVKRKKADELWVSSVPQTRKYYERQGFKPVMKGRIYGNRKYFLVKTLL